MVPMSSLPAPARVGTLDACSPSARWPRPIRGRRRAPSSPTSRSSSRRRLRRDHGRVRRRQVDAAEPRRRPRPARRRLDRGRRRRPRVARRRRADAAAPRADGLRVPGVPRAALPDRRRRTSRCRWRCSGSRAIAARRAGRARCSPRSASATGSRAVPRELSGGELQRVAIARALVHRPRWCWPTSPPATSIRTARRRARAAARRIKGQRRRGHPGHALAGRRADRRPDAAADARRPARTGIAMSAVAARSIRIGVAATRPPRRARRAAAARAARHRSRSRWASRWATRCSSSTQPAVNELAPGVQTLSGDADLEVRGPARAASTRTSTRSSRAVPDVAVASPVVEVDARARRARRRAADRRRRRLPRRAARSPALVADGGRALRPLPPGRAVPDRRRRLAGSASSAGDTLAVQAGLGDVPLRVAGLLRGRRRAALRGDGHRRGAGRVRPPGPSDARSTCALAPGADVAALRERARARAAGGRGRRAARRRAARRAPACTRVVPRQPQRARAGGAVHRRPARVLDAGAVGRAPARAARAAARARRDAAAARRRCSSPRAR